MIVDLHLSERVSKLYYEEGMSQAKIAKQMGLSSSNVSRLLAQAKEAGLVEVRLNFRDSVYAEIERALEEKFGLREAVVTPACEGEDYPDSMGVAAAFYLGRTLKPGMTLGMTWGRFMINTIRALEDSEIRRTMRIPDAAIVPLVGSVRTEQSGDTTFAQPSILGSRLADVLNCTPYSFPAPMYVKNEQVREIFVEEPVIEEALSRAKNADAAIFGAGALRDESWIATVPDAQREELTALIEQRNPAGEIIGRLYDEDGQEIDCDYNRCIIGASLDDIKKIDTRILMAAGPEKVRSVHSALKGSLANVLITDLPTAQAILGREPSFDPAADSQGR